MGIASSVITGILNSNVVNRLADLIPDSNAKLRALQDLRSEMLSAASAADASQGQVNAAEAQNTNLFISGWRPFIGWVCGMIFIYHFMLLPFILFCFSVSGKTVPLPMFDTETFGNVLYGMLGLGAMRTFEKWQGVASK